MNWPLDVFWTLVVLGSIVTCLVLILAWIDVNARVGPFELGQKDPTRNERMTLELSARDIWIKIFGGLFLITGAFATWNQMVISEKGQLIDRYTKSVDQLGAKVESDGTGLAQHLGGIYALGRIAHVSREERYSVIAVLTGYCRNKASDEPGSVPENAAILHVLCNDVDGLTKGNPSEVPLDLSGALLNRVRVNSAHLAGAILTDAELNGASLPNADLQNAQLSGASLVGATLTGAKLTGADLTGADLTGTDLRWAVGLTEQQLSAARPERTLVSVPYRAQGVELFSSPSIGAQHPKAK